MENKEIRIDEKIVKLAEVAQNGNKKLLRFESDWRVTGAPFEDVMKNFPDYKPESYEILKYDYFIEEDGKIQFYEPDGTPIDD